MILRNLTILLAICLMASCASPNIVEKTIFENGEEEYEILSAEASQLKWKEKCPTPVRVFELDENTPECSMINIRFAGFAEKELADNLSAIHLAEGRGVGGEYFKERHAAGEALTYTGMAVVVTMGDVTTIGERSNFLFQIVLPDWSTAWSVKIVEHPEGSNI